MAKVKIRVGETNGVWVDGVNIPCNRVEFKADRFYTSVMLEIVPGEVDIETDDTEIKITKA